MLRFMIGLNFHTTESLRPGFRLLISLDESDLGATIEVDVYEVQEDIIEFVHYPKDGEDVDVTVI